MPFIIASYIYGILWEDEKLPLICTYISMNIGEITVMQQSCDLRWLYSYVLNAHTFNIAI